MLSHVVKEEAWNISYKFLHYIESQEYTDLLLYMCVLQLINK